MERDEAVRATIRHMFTVGIMAIALGTFGCAATLTAAGMKVKATKTAPPPECTEIGDVSAGYEGSPEAIRNELRNKAAEKGANYLVINEIISSGMYNLLVGSGTAYHCPITEKPATVGEALSP